MAQHSIEMEMRACEKCGRRFKVMATSAQSVCSTACDRYGTVVPGAQRKALKGCEPRRESVTVTVGKPTKPSDPAADFLAKVGSWPIRKPTKNANEGITNKTRRNEMQEGLSGGEETKPGSLPYREPVIKDEGPRTPPRNAPAATVGTLPVLSEDSQSNLEKVGLDSMNLLNKSANRLMRLMEGCASPDDFDKAEEGVKRLDTHRVEVATNIANALAHTVQTQVNMVKAMTAFVRRK